MNDNPWMNSTEARDHLRLPSVEALYQCVRRGQVPGYRFGRRYRFNRLELDEVIRKGRLLTVDDFALSSEG